MPGSSPRIARVEHRALSLSLNEPFGISGGSQDQARIAVVQVWLDDGTLGIGEAAPLPAYNGETLEDVLSALEAARPLWVGAEAAQFRLRALELRPVTLQSPSARCALEVALADALARRARLPLDAWFGGSGARNLVSDVTLPIMDAATAKSAAERWWARGFRCLKIKVGSGDDLGRVRGAHAGAPGARLLLDANAGLSASAALALIDDLASAGIAIDLFEQPVAADDWAGLERVSKRVRLALDESVVDAASAVIAANRLGPPHVLNVKLMKSGIVEALDIVAVARATGLSLMIGGMLESALAMSASACFAAGQGGFEFVDLDTPLFIVNSPLRGGFEMHGDRLDLSSIELGHGVRLDESAEPSARAIED